jgi:hypothetical protein
MLYYLVCYMVYERGEMPLPHHTEIGTRKILSRAVIHQWVDQLSAQHDGKEIAITSLFVLDYDEKARELDDTQSTA